MQVLSRLLCAVTLVAASCATWAGATKSEAVSQANAVVAHFKQVGNDQGLKDLNTEPAWKTGGMNITYTDTKGLVLASSLNEKLRGKMTMEIKDPNGKEFIKDAIALVTSKGEGWIDYQFINPETKKVEDRTMYVKRYQASGLDGLIGISISK